MCVCIALCTIVAHNIAQNRPDNLLSYHPDNHHCSDDVYLREGGCDMHSGGLKEPRVRWVHISAIWRIRLNRPCVAVMRPCVKLLWPLVSKCCVKSRSACIGSLRVAGHFPLTFQPILASAIIFMRCGYHVQHETIQHANTYRRTYTVITFRVSRR